MTRCNSRLLAASSLLCLVAGAMRAVGEPRPHYGGILHISMREAPQTIDPAAAGVPASLTGLVFETLVSLDDRGQPQPRLAISWQSEPGSQRWRFFLRGGVTFHDGTPLDSAAVAACLRTSNPEWKVTAASDMVLIETESPDPDLPAELALTRYSIVRHISNSNDRGGNLSGTGPFAIAQWDAGKRATLTANEQYWAGRPFLDSVQIDFGRNDRDQMLSLDLGKADLIEVATENIHRARAENRSVVTSDPQEFMALVFARDATSDDEVHARNALALSIDTTAVNNVVLQGGGEPTGALLPNWLSGYAFIFPLGGSADRARQERMQSRRLPSWTLGYDTSDAVARIIAERILLNARDAGITLQLSGPGKADLRLVRVPLSSSDPHVALTELAKTLQLPRPKLGNGSVGDLYSAEKLLLQSHRVIPLVYLRSAVALRPNVHGWIAQSGGNWSLSNVWLSGEKP